MEASRSWPHLFLIGAFADLIESEKALYYVDLTDNPCLKLSSFAAALISVTTCSSAERPAIFVIGIALAGWRGRRRWGRRRGCCSADQAAGCRAQKSARDSRAGTVAGSGPNSRAGSAAQGRAAKGPLFRRITTAGQSQNDQEAGRHGHDFIHFFPCSRWSRLSWMTIEAKSWAKPSSDHAGSFVHRASRMRKPDDASCLCFYEPALNRS